MGSVVDALIDAAYATALDHRVSKAFAAAYRALAEEGSRIDELGSHIARARTIALSRSRSDSISLPSVTVCVEGGLMDIEPGLLTYLSDNILRVTIPSQGELDQPSDWVQVANWVMERLPADDQEALFAAFIMADGQRQNAIIRRSKSLPGEPAKLRIVFPSLHAAEAEGDPALLQRMRGLTERRAAIAQRSASGKSGGEIAGQMGIRVNTVREHIKAIYERTDINKQTDLAVLVGELNLMARTLEPGHAPPNPATGGVHLRMTNFFWTRDGRRICFSDCGDLHGRVLLKTHSSFGGRWVWEPTARLLHNFGFRLLIIERPGVGLTDPAGRDRARTSIADAIALLDHLGIDRVYGLGTSGGGFHLAETIAAHPSRFSGAAFISPRAFDVPAIAGGDYVSMVASLPLDAGALIMESMAASQTDEGWRAGIRNVLECNPVDMAALEDPALMDMHVRQQRSATVNGFEGQLLEWKDYGEPRCPPDLPDLPYAVVSGREDNVANVGQGVTDWSAKLGVKPHLVTGAGHLIFLTHTRDVLVAAGLIATN